MKRALGAATLACVLVLCVGASAAPISALDVIQLEIAYTTLLARYYVPISPRTLVDGARTGIAAELVSRGIENANVAYTAQHVSADDGGDTVDALVLQQLVRYGTRVDAHRLVEAAIAGEVAALHDPYTVVFTPPSFHRFNAFLGNETFGGIGAILSVDASTKAARIDRVLPGSPAERAGLRHADVLATIDGRASPLAVADLRDALRGKIGTSVRLGIVRDGARSDVTLVRARVRDPEVRTARFGELGYVALARFGDRAGDELAAALRDFARDGITGVVLDLGDNGGGYGDEATAVASAFIRSGPIFTLRERVGSPSVERATGNVAWTGPLAVLVNAETASAAEIVAGAVQDDGAGRVVGTRTFGKGLVQSVFPFPDGSALKMTTARYTTPAGRDIDRIGIVPDEVVVEPPGSVAGDPATDPQLATAIRSLQAVSGRVL